MGRDRQNEKYVGEHFTKMHRSTMQSEAWLSLSQTAQRLYPWLKLEWKGPKANNNGKIRLSVRQAAVVLGCTRNTAGKAFHELQAKGFIAMTESGELGVHARAKSPAFELTEIAMPNAAKPRYLFQTWRAPRIAGDSSSDFPVHKAAAMNDRGANRYSGSRVSHDNVLRISKANP